MSDLKQFNWSRLEKLITEHQKRGLSPIAITQIRHYKLAKSNGDRLIARKELIELMLKMKAQGKHSVTLSGSISKVAAVPSPKKDNICR